MSKKAKTSIKKLKKFQKIFILHITAFVMPVKIYLMINITSILRCIRIKHLLTATGVNGTKIGMKCI